MTLLALVPIQWPEFFVCACVLPRHLSKEASDRFHLTAGVIFSGSISNFPCSLTRDITSHNNCAFHSMKDDYTKNSHYLTYIHFSTEKVRRRYNGSSWRVHHQSRKS